MGSYFSGNTSPGVSPSSPTAKSPKKTIINADIRPGGLSDYGYDVHATTRSRHLALMRGVRAEGYAVIIRRLNLIATFTKNRSPNTSKVFRRDQRWLSKKHEESS